MVAAPEANKEAVVTGAGGGVEVAAAATRHHLRSGRMEPTPRRTNENKTAVDKQEKKTIS